MAKGLSKRELIQEIARETHVRPQVVELILERMGDILVEQVVNNESFRWVGLLSITPQHLSERVVPGKEEPVPAGVRPRPRLSDNVKILHRLQQGRFQDKPFIINRDTWRGALKWWKENPDERGSIPVLPRVESPSLQPQEAEFYNPLLDDDDESH